MNTIYDSDIDLAEELFMTSLTVDAIHALAVTGRSAKVVWEGEPPPFPIERNGYKLARVVSRWDLPIEVQRRINILERNGTPIADILIAHEKPKPKKKPLLVSPRQWKRPSLLKSDGHVIRDVLKGLVLGVAIFTGLLLSPLLILTALMTIPAILGALGMAVAIPLLIMYDPVVVVVLDDAPKTWISIASWYE